MNSPLRSELFALIPARRVINMFAWLVRNHSHPVKKFITFSAALLLFSFIPDYALPLEGKTFLGSIVAAFMRLAAGVVTVLMIVMSYLSRMGQ